MPTAGLCYTRRDFLATAAIATGAATLPWAPARAAAKYTRYSATSPEAIMDGRLSIKLAVSQFGKTRAPTPSFVFGYAFAKRPVMTFISACALASGTLERSRPSTRRKP